MISGWLFLYEFLLRCCCCRQVLYPGTYARNLDGCHVEMGCLSQLLQQKQPKLAAHLQVGRLLVGAFHVELAEGKWNIHFFAGRHVVLT
jgi:hypothetical protein